MTAQLSLTDQQLSAIYHTADKLSGDGQRRTKLLVRTELICLVLAAVAGVASFRVGADQLDVLAALSALFFVVALTSTVTRSISKPEEAWYIGRAAAESIRTLAWQYAMCTTSFPATMTDSVTGQLFLDRIREVLHELQQQALSPSANADDELTQAMKDMRSADLATKRAAYKQDRIEDQRGWYVRRAVTHDHKAKLWLTVTSVSSVLGVVAAGFKFFGEIDFDLLGVFGAVASAAIAWNQLNQHRNQVSAYTVTARELNIIKSQIDLVTEAEWPVAVTGWEDAISREHTMWLARRGYPGLARRP